MAENYLQHAEHYNRIIMAAQAQSAQPAGHNGSDAGQSLNGAHRQNREMNGAVRDQPQPHFDSQPLMDQRQPAIAENPHQPADDHAAVEDRPMAEEAVARDAGKEKDKNEPTGDGDSGRRRGARRRYPGGGGPGRSSAANSSAEKKDKAAAASSDEQSSDEIAAQ